MYVQTVFANVTPEQAIDHFARRGIAGFAVSGLGYDPQWGTEPVTVFVTVTDTPKSATALYEACTELARARKEQQYVQTAIPADSAVSALVTVSPDANTKSTVEVLDLPVCPNCKHRHEPPSDLTALAQELASLGATDSEKLN